MKTTSIHRKLVRSLSISITLVTIAILLLTDIAVDNWVHYEFNRATDNKINLLTTLVDEDSEGVEFDFAGEFMPEFEGAGDLEYYQLWRNKKIFERSETLGLFSTTSFNYEELKIGKKISKDIILPDGRDGQIIYYKFLPQIDSDDRVDFQAYLEKTTTNQEPMLIAYAVSTEKLNFLMWLIDISFLIAAFAVAFIVRTLVKTTVNAGLQPLEEFSRNIKKIRLAEKTADVELTHKVEELVPIQNSINTFITENRKLYLKEKRLTSDIAHELKTPIAELINLAEVTLRFPNDKELTATFTPNVLEISQRLEKIVANILLFHRYSNDNFEQNDVFDVLQVLNRLVVHCPRVKLVCEPETLVTSNLFAFETIMQNLLKNAHTHSPVGSNIKVECVAENSLYISVTNLCSEILSKDDLNFIFEPLWQKDNSRTSTHNFGLGLSIVSTFINALGGRIDVDVENNHIIFKIELPNLPSQ